MATPRLPTKSDFPPSLTLDIVPPSSGSPVNILILLHGLGDTNASFTTLGKNLNLPETAALSLQGPTPLPGLLTGSEAPSFHWSDDILFDDTKGDIDLDAGFNTSTRILKDLTDVLASKCNYPPRSILFLGFGQGAMAALAFAASALDVEFGGVVAIGGSLPSSSSPRSAKAKTPVLVCAGSKSAQVTRGSVDRLKGAFGEVECVKWERPDDGMMRNREEMLPIMKFFARRLRSRAGVPEGSVEV